MTAEEDDPRLRRLLGDDSLADLRRRLRRLFERQDPEAPPATVRLDRLTVPEHAALAGLLGRPPRPAGSLQVDIGAIDLALRRAGIADSLRQALETLDGPIPHRAAERAARQAPWTALAAAPWHQALAALLRTPAGSGLLKRLSRQDPALATTLCQGAEAVLHRLPAAGLPRAQLAAEALGDAHGLDDGAPCASLVLAAWRGQEATTPADQGEEGEEAARERRRDIWARAGVLVNELARPALFLNLPLRDGKLLAAAGEPAYASLRLLLRTPPDWEVAGRRVFVCENPNLLAIAADRLGPRCAPLACTEGMPAAAQRLLLSQLAAAGAELLYHGDFDWAGLRIANRVMAQTPARAWRFSAEDYGSALAALPDTPAPLSGPPVEAAWDAALAPAMRREGRSIPEEAVSARLLEDLGQP